MKLRVTPRAAKQFRATITFIQADSPQRAQSLLGSIDRSLDIVCDYPEVGRLIGRGRRRYDIPNTYYGLLYRLDREGNEVVLLRIFDARRDIKLT